MLINRDGMYDLFQRNIWSKLGPKNIKVINVNGAKLWVNPQDFKFYMSLLIRKSWEPEVTRYMLSILKDKVFVDVGASIGYYTILAAKVARLVYAFEPHPGSIKLLEKSVVENKLNNVVTLEKALSNFKGYFPFSIHPTNPSGHRLGGSSEVRPLVERLDDYVEEADVIKIDVEGGEVGVLKGARRLIERCKPILIVEVHNEDVVGYLKSIGKVFEIIGGGLKSVTKVRQYSHLACLPH